MQKSELEHLIRTAAAITNEYELVRQTSHGTIAIVAKYPTLT